MSWSKIKLIFKLALTIIFNPISTYNTYKYYKTHKDNIKALVNEVKPMLANPDLDTKYLEDYVRVRIKEFGLRDDLLNIVDFLVGVIENNDSETIKSILVEFGPDNINTDEIMSKLTPDNISKYKVIAVSWLKTI